MSSEASNDQMVENATVQGLEIAILIVAVLLTVILSALERNKKGGRFGIVIPIDFLKYDRLTFVYAAAFGCTSNEIIDLIFRLQSKFFAMDDISKFARPWIRVFIWLLWALLVALKFYPLLAVIRCKRIIVEPLLGFFYTGFIFAAFIYRLDTAIKETSYPLTVLIFIPSIVCYIIIIVYFLYNIYKHIRRVITKSSNEDSVDLQRRCASQNQYQYVKWLLTKNNIKASEQHITPTRMRAMKQSLVKRLGFNSQLRGSPRVISTFVVSGIVLYKVGILMILLFSILKPQLRNSVLTLYANTTVLSSVNTLLTVVDVGFHISFTISSIFIVLYLIVIYTKYRKDIEKMHRGDYSFLPMKTRKTMNDNLVAASLRYAGFQIASLVWGYILWFFALLCLCIAVAYTVVLPLKGDVPFSFFEPAYLLLCLFIIGQIITRFQCLLSRKFFLQEYSVENIHSKLSQRSLALNNTRCFNVITFFAFFYHAIIGILAALRRVLIGLVIGLMAMARTDKCMLPVGFEKFDKAYSTYVGVILVELHHRNPVVTVFCDILLSKKRAINVLLKPVSSYSKETDSQRHRRVRRRWQKAYTMLNNPLVRLEVRNGPADCSPDEIQVAV